MNWANKIKAIRKADGLTQKELAEELKVSVCTLRGWEHGYHEPNTQTKRLIKAYQEERRKRYEIAINERERNWIWWKGVDEKDAYIRKANRNEELAPTELQDLETINGLLLKVSKCK